MKPSRTMLLVASGLLVIGLLVGGLAVRVGADDGSFRQTVLFSEILSLILDNYVDPLEADALLRGAYEGMLGGLDPNGAYLTTEEVREWKAGRDAEAVDPGLSVLKVGRTVQVVAVAPESRRRRRASRSVTTSAVSTSARFAIFRCCRYAVCFRASRGAP